MSISRPFAYNTGSPIAGTEQIGNLAIGFPTEGFSSTGLAWWNGPDEQIGYVVAQSVPDNSQPTPIEGVFASVGFFRSSELTESSFVDLANTLAAGADSWAPNQGAQAKIWLNNNGYWTSFEGSIAPSNTPTPSMTPTLTPTPTNTPTPTPTQGGGIVPFILRIDTTLGGQNPGLAESNLVFVNDLYYDFIIDWGDDQTESIIGLGSQIVGGNGRLTHFYSEPGLYDIQIFSNLPFALQTLNDDGSIKYVGKEWREIVQWGNCVWYTLRGAFANMFDLQITATDTPNLSQCLSFQSAFNGCENLTGGNIGSWNIGSSPATSFREMFFYCSNFNANINNWNVSNGVDFFMMFFLAGSFNSPLNNWNVCNATEMNFMLRSTAFDQDISSWKVPLILEEPANFCVASPFCSDPSKKPQWGVSC